MGFFLETLMGGLMAGMLYSLIALGFVLIYKASGVFNFAQGAMVLFAALAMARFAEWIPQWTGVQSLLLANLMAFVMAMAVMVVVAYAIEKLALSRLVNQEGITLLMATLGITYFLDGLGQTLFGNDIYKIDVGMPKDPVIVGEKYFEGGILLSKEDLYAALIAATLVALLALFFQKTSTGRALRAVADDHQAAQSIGIPLSTIWVIVWSVAGFVALVAGKTDLKLDLRPDQKDFGFVIVLTANVEGKAFVAVSIDESINASKGLDAQKIIKEIVAPLIKGGGGGQKLLATAGGQDASNLSAVIEKVKGLL